MFCVYQLGCVYLMRIPHSLKRPKSVHVASIFGLLLFVLTSAVANQERADTDKYVWLVMSWIALLHTRQHGF